MQSWYIRDDDVESVIGPVAFDELVARTWDGSITPYTAILERNGTSRWQTVRDVEVVGPLLEAVAAGRPSGRHWQRLQRRVADGTLWHAMFKSTRGPWLVGVAVVVACSWWSGHQFIKPSTVADWLGWGYVLQPRYSLPWWLAHVGNWSVVALLGLLAQISWYVIYDIARDRRARLAARSCGSAAKHDEKDAAIFVYDLAPEALGRLKQFNDAIASPGDDYGMTPRVAHHREDEDRGGSQNAK